MQRKMMPKSHPRRTPEVVFDLGLASLTTMACIPPARKTLDTSRNWLTMIIVETRLTRESTKAV
jgi:hypothetical protein